MRVVNDTAQRCVKLFEEFNRLIANNEEKQCLLQVVVVNRNAICLTTTKKAVVDCQQRLQFLDSKTVAVVEVIKPEQSTLMV